MNFSPFQLDENQFLYNHYSGQAICFDIIHFFGSAFQSLEFRRLALFEFINFFFLGFRLVFRFLLAGTTHPLIAAFDGLVLIG